MSTDLLLIVAGLGVGVVVGLTGMGGGALMTPLLVLFFGVPPLAAVSSDLMASLVMKPVGGLVHLRRGTVDKRLAGWLCVGSVPAAFGGVLVARSFGDGARMQQVVQLALGAALLLAVAGLAAKAFVGVRDRSRGAVAEPSRPVRVRPVPTVLVGAVGGLIVGMTSVGSGSLIIVALLVLYPMLSARDLVGTDLVQAVPLVAAATLAHLAFGDFRLSLTAFLLVGALPGVYVGAKLSSRAPGAVVRRALGLVLLASGLKMLGVGNLVLLAAVAGGLLVCVPGWLLLRPVLAARLTARAAPAAAADRRTQ
ncbi:UPF0721 transmembrane protein [Actinocatenispora thailandica]|uniref:Probable membrane transporter protein n=1 Tax=Actinocatenispora thailandica TaxID=227318 RepID=A0A7R7HUY1_9ACTN|nr:sulfite exporter TauE/SafE family protein [Actinocatenispora thailandica]BCJ32976.1 UPF0721 transmembrane protein [Actinocatenispora thailandica]